MKVSTTIKIYATIILASFFLACEKEISINLKIPEDMLCLNCILEAGIDSVLITVTNIQSVENEADFNPVENAHIEFRKEGQLLEGIIYQGNGRYLLSHKPESGKKYEVNVKVDGYKTLNAETTIPVFPVVQAKYLPDTIYDKYWVNGYRTIPKLEVNLRDSPAKDFYWFKLAKRYYLKDKVLDDYYVIYKTDNLFFDEFNRYYDQDYEPPFTNYEYIGALRLEEEFFLNKTLRFSLSSGPGNTLFVINGDLHFDKYYKSSIKQFLTYDYDNLPIFEPVQVYSNITNGFGIFGSIAISEFYIDDKK